MQSHRVGSRATALVASVLALAAPAVLARTLTSADGRVIEAEVLGFEGADKVIIKRADTGQSFTLPFTTFSEAEQRALRAEAAEAAKKNAALREGDITLALSRAAFAKPRAAALRPRRYPALLHVRSL
jgi:hypothetical protein